MFANAKTLSGKLNSVITTSEILYFQKLNIWDQRGLEEIEVADACLVFENLLAIRP